MFIYVITNLITGKVYIGQHKGDNLKQYLQKKFWYSRNQKTGSSYLFNAMRKYDEPDQWSISPLFDGIETKVELDRLETLLIALYDTRNPEIGYNICKGGEGFTGEFTVEHRAKLSKAAKQSWNNDPQRKLVMSELKAGVPRPLDVRARISKGNTGKTHSIETRAKLRANRLIQADPRLGTRHTEDTKRQISVAKKGLPSTFLGKNHTYEAKKKNRQAHILDLTGQQFGNILSVELFESSSHASWRVRCLVCAAEGVVTRSSRVVQGKSRFARAHRHIEQISTI
jgi:group I intron endonuclease